MEEPIKEETSVDKETTALYKTLSEIVTSQPYSPERFAVVILAFSHVVVSLAFNASDENQEKALELIAASIGKAIQRRKFALEYDDEKPKEETT